MNQTIAFTTYPSLQSKFKKVCELRCTTMTQQLETLIRDYLKGNIGTLDTLRSFLCSAKDSSIQEIKNQKMSIKIDSDLYQKLKDNLSESRTRPASFFTILMSYTVSFISAKELHGIEAQSIIDNSNDSSIMHVVYALEYFKPEINAPNKLVHTEFFYELCTEDRFSYYQKIDMECPLISVLAKHRNVASSK